MQLREREILEKLVATMDLAYNSPIGSTNFCENWRELNALLDQAKQFLKDNRPPSITESRMIVDGCMGEQEVIVFTFGRPK
jgi:hypothetical protein